MMFDRQRRTITVDGQDIILAEFSAADMTRIMSIENDNEQTLESLAAAIESPKVTAEEISTWPNRVVAQILTEVFDLNGLGTQGN